MTVPGRYAFWNAHEPTPGVYDFTGRLDILAFLRAAQDAGLFVNMRIGPYVPRLCAHCRAA